MNRTINFQSAQATMPTTDIMRVIITLLGVLANRAANELRAVLSAAWRWLNTEHTYFKDDGDEAVICTGWRVLGIGLASVIIAFILGINFESLLA